MQVLRPDEMLGVQDDGETERDAQSQSAIVSEKGRSDFGDRVGELMVFEKIRGSKGADGMRIKRRAFMEMAGATALAVGVPEVRLNASPAPQATAGCSGSQMVELAKLPFFHGREYFVLRSGRAQVIFQLDRADVGPAFTHMVFDVETASQNERKERAFNFDPASGFSSTALQVELGGFSFTALGEQTEAHWVNADGIPAVEAIWWAGGVKVTEHIIALADAQAFLETIQLDGSSLAGDDAVTVKLLLPGGQTRASGSVLVQNHDVYGCGIAVLGEAPAAHRGSGRPAHDRSPGGGPSKSGFGSSAAVLPDPVARC